MSAKVNFRIGKSRFFQGLVIFLSCCIVIPLFAILLFIIISGASKINWEFLTSVPKAVGEMGGGISNAIIGSLLIVFLASLIAIPIGILCGIFLAENKKSRLSYWARLCVDILQGVPSIIIGIVAYLWIVKPLGYSAYSGSIALAVMMLPIVIRSTEETLNLLPDSLKEAGYALGMPYHRVVLKILVPCGFSGIISGVILSVGRIAGETAPLLFTALGSDFLTTKMNKPMGTLPLLIFKYATSPYTQWKDLAWGASVILLVWVLLLNIITKIITRKWKVQL